MFHNINLELGMRSALGRFARHTIKTVCGRFKTPSRGAPRGGKSGRQIAMGGFLGGTGLPPALGFVYSDTFSRAELPFEIGRGQIEIRPLSHHGGRET